MSNIARLRDFVTGMVVLRLSGIQLAHRAGRHAEDPLEGTVERWLGP